MFQIFKEPKFQFLKYRFLWISISLALILATVGAYKVKGGFNFGIDFAGGTQLTLKFLEKPKIEKIRSALLKQNLGDVVLQEFDEPGLNELLIRVENTGKEGDIVSIVLEALKALWDRPTGKIDLNLAGKDVLKALLLEKLPEKEQEITVFVENFAKVKKEKAIFKTFDEVKTIPAISPMILKVLKEEGYLGPFSLLGAENVGPKVGKDLRQKATQAIIWSLIGMMIYIWVRFRHWAFGLGAMIALFHDVTIALGFFLFTGREINLTVVAALLTLVGYSVNDTVVVFDRIRENLRKKRRIPFVDLVNQSVNETLSRTIITSGTTFLAVMSLYLLGGDVINNFAFALLIGIIVGTYSSIFIASPIVVAFYSLREKRKHAKA